MASRSRDPVRTRERILSTAASEFARHGFGGARVDGIAAKCRLSKNMLYYYFQSKEGLFVAVLERMYEKLREAQHDLAIREQDPVTALKALVQHTFAALLANPDAIWLMNEENRHKGRHIRQSRRMRDLYNPLVETIALLLERGSAAGVFRPGIDPAVVYVSLSSLCYHYLSNQYTLEVALGRDLRSDAARADWLAHITEMVLLFCSSDPAALSSAALPTRAARARRIA
jgi:TetR/AcrR family transcriptional regulator